MIFKFCSLLPFALALSSLGAVDAISPRLVSSSVEKEPQIKSDIQLNNQDTNVHFTFYNVGLGACGKTNAASDFVVALNSQEYGSGSQCFKTIRISALGKSTTAMIVDECPGCTYGGLDLSKSLFQFFAPLSDGNIIGSWSYI